MVTTSTVKTAFGESYLKRLCRHFAHKIPASAEGQQGKIEFPFGLCRIEVDDQEMRIRIQVDDSENVEKAEKVVGEHLVRMANRDEPVVVWVRQTT
ncbi:MAG: DUF2218 domain-containing protein [Woeseia sp.]|nr:DUF2218 domain-containing protein [Woeseia sp.]NNE60939.1 DUF2218 domain-containing protein [Woeseia sp.]NNL53985.1 DUF2218 domain-containing protein [Woeseia sp.]